MIKKEQYGLLFIILGCVFLNFLNSPLSEIFFDDKEIFKYAGFVIFKGGVPYRDVFDHKPPLIFFLNALGWYNSWIPWFLDTMLVLLATVLFYSLCKQNKLTRPWFFPLIFNLLIRYSLVSFGNGLTREYTTIFLLIFFCVMQGNARYKYYLLGLLTGLTFWMQQDAIITLAPFICYALFINTDIYIKNNWKRSMALVAGFIIISLPIMFYFIAHHSLSYLWRDAFLFNLHAPGAQSGFLEKIKAIKHAIHEAEFEMAFYTALILGLTGLLLKCRNPALLATAFLGLILSMPGEFLTGRLQAGNAFIYYLLPLSATIPVLVYVVFTETQVSFLQDKTAQLIFNLIISTTLFLGTIRYISGFRMSDGKNELFGELPAIEYLNTQTLGDAQLYVFDNSNLVYLYNHYKILSPSRWIYHFFWTWSAGWDTDDKILGSILQDLKYHHTRFILDFSEMRRDFKNQRAYLEWQNFLKENYVPVTLRSSNKMLWRLQ